MRKAFIETLCKLAQKDERVWLLTGDLGYSVLEPFAAAFPGRYVNMGVAEQNMTGVAAGLALSGKIVFTYSIANFPVMRCMEQIRNDICYHNLNVKIVAVGGGVAYGPAGYSHHATEDLAMMRVLPNMTVLAPGDPVEARLATRSATAHEGPCYLRLGKGGEPVLHRADPSFEIGKSITLREGKDLSIVSTGGILHEAMSAAGILARQGLDAAIISMPSLQPIDGPAILALCKKGGPILTVEEHGPGGLGSAVAEIVANSDTTARLISLKLKPEHYTATGDQKYLRSLSGIDARGIADTVLETLRQKYKKEAIHRKRELDHVR